MVFESKIGAGTKLTIQIVNFRSRQYLPRCLFSISADLPVGIETEVLVVNNDEEILDEIVPRFTALQVYQAIMESLASEHAARMVAMKNATDSATELAGALQLEYNKARQQGITGEILDIVGGVEALATK